MSSICTTRASLNKREIVIKFKVGPMTGPQWSETGVPSDYFLVIFDISVDVRLKKTYVPSVMISNCKFRVPEANIAVNPTE